MAKLLKNKLNTSLVLAGIALIALLFSIIGIDNGLPSKKIKSLLFTSEEMAVSLIPRIVEIRQVDKEYTDSLRKYKKMEIAGRYYMNLPANYFDDIERENEIILTRKKMYVSENKLKWMGNYLIGSFCPEEQVIMHSISRLNLKKLDFNTHLLSYGGAYIYSLAASIKLGSLFNIVKLTTARAYNMLNPQNVQKIFILARLVGIVAFLLSVIPMYLVSSSLYQSRFIGLFSSFLLATNAGFLARVHYLNPWLFSALWVLLSLYFSSRIGVTQRDAKYYVLSGIASGLALGSVFLAGFVFLPLALFHFYKYKLRKIKLLFYAFFSMAVAFIITSPYYLTSLDEYLNGLRYTNESWLGRVSYFSLSQHMRNIYEIIQSFGIIFSLLILGGILLAIFKRKKEDIILAASLIAYYLVCYKVISLKYASVTHITPLIPLIIMLGLRALQWIEEYSKSRVTRILFIFLAIVIIFNSFSKGLFCALKLKTMPSVECGEWINANIPIGSTIGSCISKDGTQVGYPPYNYLNYYFINDYDVNLPRIKSQKPDYYIAVSLPYSKEPFYKNIELYKNYRQIKSCKTDIPILSRIYKNELLHIWPAEIAIFERI